MLDVVANHVAPVDLSFHNVVPFNDPAYYHAKCDIDFND
jgi:alpha-amylase